MSSAMQHEALVTACLPTGEVVVRMEPMQAEGCAGCALSASCGPRKHKSGESIELRVNTACGRSSDYEPGERVVISPVRGSTTRAATLLLTLPLAGLVAGTVIASAAGASDGLAALWGLAGAIICFVPALLSRKDSGKLRWKIDGKINSTTDR